MSENRLRLTLSSAFVIAIFAIIHFVAGYALVFVWMRLASSQMGDVFGRVLVNVWWFPAQQLYWLYHPDGPVWRFAFPVANSLLWGTVAFVIWKARRGQYFRFSVRSLLVTTTVVAVLLGAIGWLKR